jgi:glycosyltransferase involved in cell wall biosynthesis
MPQREPRVVVFTTLFPHPGQPGAGLFIRERMFRVARVLPLTVVAPQPWFPLQGLLRRWRPGYRPPAPAVESQEGIEVRHPRFFSIPGAFKGFDGFFMALCCLPTMLRLKRVFAFNVIDAHFAYPDGYAATLLGRWLRTPVTITLRGTEVPLSRDPARRRRIRKALDRAARVFSVSESLKRHVIDLGADGDKIRVIGNGVDVEKFRRIPKEDARDRLGLPRDAPVLISVGALVERKGFHRVMECLPQLRARFPRLRYLVVGGASPEGDWRAQLERHVDDLQLADCVTFLGAMPPAELKVPLSAADVFVLATRNEGWANVFLEAMACGLPVVTTDVGGNAEVVSRADLGRIVAFGDRAALLLALDDALSCSWDRQVIVAHAHANRWDARVATLVDEFRRIAFAASDAVAARSLEGGRP